MTHSHYWTRARSFLGLLLATGLLAGLGRNAVAEEGISAMEEGDVAAESLREERYDRLRLVLGTIGLREAVVIGCRQHDRTIVATRVRNPHKAGVEAWFTVGAILGAMDALEFEGTLCYLPVYDGKVLTGVLIPIESTRLLDEGTVEGYQAFRKSMTPIRFP